MNNAMIAASVTMGQLQRQLDTVSHNIANQNTSGYKSRGVQFSDLLYQQVNNQSKAAMEAGRLTPAGLRRGAGAKVSQTQLNLEQGPLQQTERELDFAITAENHFFFNPIGSE